MITFSAAFEAAVSRPNCVCDWLCILKPTGTVPLRFSEFSHDFENDGSFRGIVKKWNGLDEEIDLKKMKLKSTDMRLQLFNVYHNEDGLLSSELYSNSTEEYLNQNIDIICWAAGVDYVDLPTIYTGRLVDIKYDIDYVWLDIEERRPWDLIKVPNIVTANGVHVPLVMGLFHQSSSIATSPNDCDYDAYWPAPVVEVAGGNIRALLHEDADERSNEWIAGIFQEPFNFVYPLATTGYSDGNDGELVDNDEHFYEEIDSADYYVGQAALCLRHTFYSNQLTKHDDNEFDDFSNIGLTAASYASKLIETQYSPYTNYEYSLWGNIPKPDHWWKEYTSTAYRLFVKIEEESGTTINAALNWQFQLTVKIGAVMFSLKPGDGEYWIDPYSESFPYEETFTLHTYGYVEGEETDTIEVHCKIRRVSGHADDVLNYTFSLNSYRLEYHVQSTEEENDDLMFRNAGQVKRLYFAADGLEATYDGGSGALEKGHEMLRELIHRYAGLDYDAGAGELPGWSDLDGDRTSSAWNCRLWELKPVELKKLIERLQMHSQCIWQQQNDSARIIYVKSSYTSNDVDHDIYGDDIKGLKVKLTGVNDIISSIKYKYDRHPATDDYNGEISYENANRGDWNFAEKENIETVELRYGVSPSAIWAVMNNINGEPKIIVTGELYHAKFQNMQTGDIVAFKDMPYPPFGKSWSNTYFMIDKLKRDPDRIEFRAREVG